MRIEGFGLQRLKLGVEGWAWHEREVHEVFGFGIAISLFCWCVGRLAAGDVN